MRCVADLEMDYEFTSSDVVDYYTTFRIFADLRIIAAIIWEY